MSELETKIINVYDNLSTLLLSLRKICVTKIKDIPTMIDKIVVGENKINSYINKSIETLEEDDLKGMTSIGDEMFADFNSLTDIAIPNSVTSIGYCAFIGCFKLANIYMQSMAPPIIGGSAFPFTTTLTIHVPVGSRNAYVNATNWSNYADKIVEDIVLE